MSVYAKIIISVKYDVAKLTQVQRDKAEIADKDIWAEHPLDIGIESIDLKLQTYLDDCFNYLGAGKEAVEVSWGDE